MRLRLLIEVEADEFLRGEVARAIELQEPVDMEMPSWGSAVTGRLVGAVPAEDPPSLQALAGHRFVPEVKG